MTGTPDQPPPDLADPETTITKAPGRLKVKTKKKRARATVSFESSEAGATFECQLDGSGYSACTSPKPLSVKKGNHTLLVRAVDAAGNVDPSPASATIKVAVKKKKKRKD